MKKAKTIYGVSYQTALKELIPELKQLIDLSNKKNIYHVGGR